MTTPRLRHHLFVNQYQLCSTEKPEKDTLLHQVLSPEYKALREIADRLTTGEDILFAATCASASPLAVVPSVVLDIMGGAITPSHSDHMVLNVGNPY